MIYWGPTARTAQTAISLWDASAKEATVSAPLSSEGVVDLAIIGEGFTGLSTVLHYAEKGLSAQIIEAA